MNHFKKMLHLAIVVVAMMASIFTCYAAEPENKEQPFRMKTIEGEVMGKTRYNLSVQYKQEGNQLFEALLPLGEKIKFSGGYRSYQDVNAGDTIRADFKEPYKVDDEGKEVRAGREVVSIMLLRSGSGGKLVSRGNR